MALGLFAFACERSVARPPEGAPLFGHLEVEPAFVQPGAAFELSFLYFGPSNADLRYSLDGERFESCVFEAQGGDIFSCPGVVDERQQDGRVSVVIEARDADGVSIASVDGTLVIDGTCPRLLEAQLRPSVAAPGDRVRLTFESSEELGGVPQVSRSGVVWEEPVQDGLRYQLDHIIDDNDLSSNGDVRITLIDRAGNTSLGCGTEILSPLAVDQQPPLLDANRIYLDRRHSGAELTLTASAGAVSDDVRVQALFIFDDSNTVLAELQPASDGSLSGVQIGSSLNRVEAQAVDAYGRRSARLQIRENWYLGFEEAAAGRAAGATLRSGVRLHPAPPSGVRAMRDQTIEAALVRVSDERSLVVRANIGFESVGALPGSYEDTNSMFAGYEPMSGETIVVGGYRGADYIRTSSYVDGVLSLHWDEHNGRYVVEQLSSLSVTDSNVPSPRFGTSLAFDGSGCGVLYGGDYLITEMEAGRSAELWRFCVQADGLRYQWHQIPVPIDIDGVSLERVSPTIWDPHGQQFVSVGGTAAIRAQVVFIQPAIDPTQWSVRLAADNLPARFQERSGDAYLFYDPRLEGFSLGLGGVRPGSSGEARLQWSYVNGEWLSSDGPGALEDRFGFGWAYDSARRQMVLWGGRRRDEMPSDDVWYLTGTATTGPSAWRSASLQAPAVRDFPSMVYDAERQVVLMFGGVRLDGVRPITPEIYQLVSAPAFPIIQAEFSLGTHRPEGIEAIEFFLRALGLGDLSPGFSVAVWDTAAGMWVQVPGAFGTNVEGLESAHIVLHTRPERFVSPEGQIAVAIWSTTPASESSSARLELDLIEGQIRLQPGVDLQ